MVQQDSEYEISFVLNNVAEGLANPAVSALEDRHDAVVSAHSGLLIATITCSGPDVTRAGAATVRLLHTNDVQVERTYPDLVTRQDIADRAECSRQAVGNWANGIRYAADPFPRPIYLIGGGLWLWGDVEPWLERHGREPDGIVYPTLIDHARLDRWIADRNAALGNGFAEIAAISDHPRFVDHHVSPNFAEINESEWKAL
jgi:hypothetical protein